MPITTFQALKENLESMASKSESIASKEAVLEENLHLLGSPAEDTPRKLPDGHIDLSNLGELGRILSILPALQAGQLEGSFGRLDNLVKRACELSIALLSHTPEDMRTDFIIRFCPQLTLCSDIKYYIEFIKLLKEDSRYNFTTASDAQVIERFRLFNKIEDTWRIAANYAALALLPENVRGMYIDNFKKLVKNIDFTWVQNGTPPPQGVLESSPRADYLIDLLAIMPEKNRLDFAKNLVNSIGDLSECSPPNLQSLEKIIPYLTTKKDKVSFAAYFKIHFPLFHQEIELGKCHADPVINEVFNNQDYPHFFENKPISPKGGDRPYLSATQDAPHDLSQASLQQYVESCGKELDARIKQLATYSQEMSLDQRESRSIDSLSFCESVLFPTQERVARRIGWWPSCTLSWLANRAAFLFVTELSNIRDDDQKVRFAEEHMQNVAWTDMSYLMKAIELLPQAYRFQFIQNSSNLSDTELQNCKTVWSIVGVMEAVRFLQPEEREPFLLFFKQKTHNINWELVANGKMPLISPKAQYLIGALFIMPEPHRLAFAHRLLNEVRIYENGPHAKLPPKSIEPILDALIGTPKTDIKAYIDRFVVATLCNPVEEREVRAYSLLQEGRLDQPGHPLTPNFREPISPSFYLQILSSKVFAAASFALLVLGIVIMPLYSIPVGSGLAATGGVLLACHFFARKEAAVDTVQHRHLEGISPN